MTPFKIKKILIPLDFSPTSLRALDYAAILAKQTDAEVTLLHVMEHMYVTSDPFFATAPQMSDYQSDFSEFSNKGLTKASEIIQGKGISKIKMLSSEGRTHKEIITVAKKMKADIIVMGTHGVSGFSEFIAGSNASRVASDAPCPVLTVQKKNKATGFKYILVPFSDRPHSREKVMHAIKMAEIYGAPLHVLGVDAEESKAHAKKISLEANQIKKIVEKYGVECKTTIISGPYNDETILTHAKKSGADLIVVTGDALKENLSEYFRGAVARQMINHSKVPVLTVPAHVDPKLIEMWQGI